MCLDKRFFECYICGTVLRSKSDKPTLLDRALDMIDWNGYLIPEVFMG